MDEVTIMTSRGRWEVREDGDLIEIRVNHHDPPFIIDPREWAKVGALSLFNDEMRAFVQDAAQLEPNGIVSPDADTIRRTARRAAEIIDGPGDLSATLSRSDTEGDPEVEDEELNTGEGRRTREATCTCPASIREAMRTETRFKRPEREEGIHHSRGCPMYSATSLMGRPKL